MSRARRRRSGSSRSRVDRERRGQRRIDILPALPRALPDGTLRGVCARGGFELDLAWKDGRLTRLTVLSKAGEPCKIRYQGEVREFPTEKRRRYEIAFPR